MAWGARTEQVWSDETDFILAESHVATAKTLLRRRHLIERRGDTWPLHLLGNPIGVVRDADARKPERWNPVGPPGDRPLGWMERRAWWEWHWFRGIDPMKTREPIPLSVKAAVIERDWPYCQICGGRVALGEQHLDHIVPYSHGGPSSVANLRLTHDLCNIRRGARV